MTARMTYVEQLKHPNWQRRRLEILNRAGFKCERCEDAETTLHVHHRIYRKGAMAWEYSDADLVALCENCHAEETDIRHELAEALARLDAGDLQRLLGFAKATAIMQLQDAEPVGDERVFATSYDEAEGLAIGLGRAEEGAIEAFCSSDGVAVSSVLEALKSYYAARRSGAN